MLSCPRAVEDRRAWKLRPLPLAFGASMCGRMERITILNIAEAGKRARDPREAVRALRPRSKLQGDFLLQLVIGGPKHPC